MCQPSKKTCPHHSALLMFLVTVRSRGSTRLTFCFTMSKPFPYRLTEMTGPNMRTLGSFSSTLQQMPIQSNNIMRSNKPSIQSAGYWSKWTELRKIPSNVMWINTVKWEMQKRPKVNNFPQTCQNRYTFETQQTVKSQRQCIPFNALP